VCVDQVLMGGPSFTASSRACAKWISPQLSAIPRRGTGDDCTIEVVVWP
jgi:hypothetical protein